MTWCQKIYVGGRKWPDDPISANAERCESIHRLLTAKTQKVPVWLLTTTITLCTQTLSVPFDLNHSPAAAAEQACVKAVVKFNQKYCWSGWQLATGRSSLGHRRAGGLQEPISGARGAPVYPISALHHTPLHHLRHQLRRHPNPQTQRKKWSEHTPPSSQSPG